MKYVTLSNGVKMPILGYGVYQVTPDECERCVLDALEVGYRSIDTAQSYFNEEQVGSAMQKSGIPRKELFLTTKVWIEHYGYEPAKASVLKSMEKLQTDYLAWCCCTSPSPIPTAPGVPWRSCMRRERFGPSASPTSTQTAWWTLPPLTGSNPWSIRWRRISSP